MKLSTVDDYLKAVQDFSIENEIKFPIVTQPDFFPYIQAKVGVEKSENVWSGFYSTNPFFKH